MEENSGNVSVSTDLDRSKKYYLINHEYQRMLGFLSIIFTAIATGLVYWWMAGDGDGFIGGVNMSTHTFSFHPICMILGMFFSFVTAMLSFRILPISKKYSKFIHALFHSLAIVCIVTGITCVFLAHNYPDSHASGSYAANLYTLHSFIGLSTVIIYGQNFLLGLYFFYSSAMRSDTGDNIVDKENAKSKRSYQPLHEFMGYASFIFAIMAIETGLVELLTKKSCYWSPTSINWNTAATYSNLTLGCRVGNAAGIFVMIGAIFAIFTFVKLPQTNKDGSLKE